jgi:hypothetical protein
MCQGNVHASSDYTSGCLCCALLALPAELSAFDGARSGRHFAVPVGHSAGKPQPLGPTLVAATQASRPQEAACTLNFAVSDESCLHEFLSVRCRLHSCSGSAHGCSWQCDLSNMQRRSRASGPLCWQAARCLTNASGSNAGQQTTRSSMRAVLCSRCLLQLVTGSTYYAAAPDGNDVVEVTSCFVCLRPSCFAAPFCRCSRVTRLPCRCASCVLMAAGIWRCHWTQSPTSQEMCGTCSCQGSR